MPSIIDIVMIPISVHLYVWLCITNTMYFLTKIVMDIDFLTIMYFA